MNFQTKDLVNLKVEFLKGPYENYKTKFGSEQFMVGRKVDFKKPHTDKGNFEVAVINKGDKLTDDSWSVMDFEK